MFGRSESRAVRVYKPCPSSTSLPLKDPDCLKVLLGGESCCCRGAYNLYAYQFLYHRVDSGWSRGSSIPEAPAPIMATDLIVILFSVLLKTVPLISEN